MERHQVLKLRGQKLEVTLLDVARQQVAFCLPSTFCSWLWQLTFQILNAMFVLVYPEHVPLMSELQEADELIIGLPVSADGRETPQSNKVRSVVGRLAVQAAERFVASLHFQNLVDGVFGELS